MIHAVIMTPTAGYRGWMDCTPRHLEQVRPHGRQIHAHTPISPTAAPSLWDSPERLALTKHVERYHGPELAKQCRQLGPSPLLPMQHFVDIVLDVRQLQYSKQRNLTTRRTSAQLSTHPGPTRRCA